MLSFLQVFSHVSIGWLDAGLGHSAAAECLPGMHKRLVSKQETGHLKIFN